MPLFIKNQRQQLTTDRCQTCDKQLTESEAFLSFDCFECTRARKKLDNEAKRKKPSSEIDDIIN